MTIQTIAQLLETWAPLHFSESYDNVGLITGQLDHEVKGVLICLDSTENIVQEAIDLNCNLIIAHHPIIFKGLKKLNGANYVERTVIKAIRNDMAIYALHTNLDNIRSGVNAKITSLLGLKQVELFRISNPDLNTGSGMVGLLDVPLNSEDFLSKIKRDLQLPIIKHTSGLKKTIQKVAVCGGSGSFLIPQAQQEGVDALITSDLKYHEYFEADGRFMLLDIGHFESERFTIDLIEEYLKPQVGNLPLFKTLQVTNPVQYFL